MPNVVARFVFWKTALYCVGLILFGSWFLCLPVQSHQSFVDFLRSTRYSRWWPLGIPGAAGAIGVGGAMLIRLLIFRRSALYEDAGRFIMLFPFLWSVNISDILEITKYTRQSPIIRVNKIRILLKSGREKFIGTAFLDEDWGIIIERMHNFRVHA